jgi:hypothetical protein
MTVLSGVVVTIGCIAYFALATNSQPRPGSYRAAVRRVLDAERVDYRDVVVTDGCAPSYQFCRTYAGSVQVLAATAMPGRIDCRERWTTCTLTVPQTGISGAPLDDVRDPFLARWEALYGRFMEWMRIVNRKV